VLALLEGPNCPAIGFLGGELNHHVVALDFDGFKGEAWFRINWKRRHRRMLFFSFLRPVSRYLMAPVFAAAIAT
jgi:hypothetical protein